MKQVVWMVGLASLMPAAFAQSSIDGMSGSNDVVVEISGKKLTLADFERERPVGLFQARNNFYKAERNALDAFVDQYVLEEQARKESVSVDKLLEIHVTNTLPPDPSEDTLRVYYEGTETTQPFDDVKDQIVEAIRQRRATKAKAAYVKSLRDAAKVGYYLAPPRALPVLKETPVLGPKDAPVVMVEYSDYECPYCQAAQADLDKVIAEFKGKLSFGYKDTPLPMHPHAQKAAEAAHCANEQGKFWAYHDMLFATKQLEIPQLKEHARKLNLDGDAFDKCLDSGAQADQVKATLSEGTTLGIEGTPSFLINGRFFGGSMSYDELHKIIEEELTVATRSAAAGGRTKP